jgi:hypothetical protein
MIKTKKHLTLLPIKEESNLSHKKQTKQTNQNKTKNKNRILSTQCNSCVSNVFNIQKENCHTLFWLRQYCTVYSTKYVRIKSIPQCLSPRRNWDSPHPLSRQRVCPSPRNHGGGGTLACGWGVVLFLLHKHGKKYFPVRKVRPGLQL